MAIERANEVLVKCTHLTFSNRERLSVTVRQLSQNAIVTLFQMLDILESKEGSLINLGLKFTKRGECRVRIGKNVIISIPDAGTRKEFQTKLLRRWTNHDRYIWYSEEDKLEVLSGMEFDGELKDRLPMCDVIWDDTCEDESKYDDCPDLSDVSLDETTEQITLGTIGSNAAGRGSNKANLTVVIAMATHQMTGMTRSHMRVVDVDEEREHRQRVTEVGRQATELAIENDKVTEDEKRNVVVVGNPNVAYLPNDPTGIVACITEKLNSDTAKHTYTPDDVDDLPW